MISGTGRQARVVDHGLFAATDFARLDDGSYVCAGHGGSPVVMRCIHQDGSQIDAVDSDGNSKAFRLVPFPNADYNEADTA